MGTMGNSGGGMVKDAAGAMRNPLSATQRSMQTQQMARNYTQPNQIAQPGGVNGTFAATRAPLNGGITSGAASGPAPMRSMTAPGAGFSVGGADDGFNATGLRPPMNPMVQQPPGLGQAAQAGGLGQQSNAGGLGMPGMPGNLMWPGMQQFMQQMQSMGQGGSLPYMGGNPGQMMQGFGPWMQERMQGALGQMGNMMNMSAGMGQSGQMPRPAFAGPGPFDFFQNMPNTRPLQMGPTNPPQQPQLAAAPGMKPPASAPGVAPQGYGVSVGGPGANFQAQAGQGGASVQSGGQSASVSQGMSGQGGLVNIQGRSFQISRQNGRTILTDPISGQTIEV